MSLLQVAVAVATGVIETVLAAAADRADGALAAFQGADEGAGDFFFGERLRFFVAGPASIRIVP